MIITRPAENSIGGWYAHYIAMAAYDDLIKGLYEVNADTRATLEHLDENILNFRYESDKWTIKEIIGHLSDTERVFTYRAMRFARKDNTPLPGFDQNNYIEHANFNERSIKDLLDELDVIRHSTIALYKSFNAGMLDHVAVANNIEVTPRALGFVTLGHQMHHMVVVKERYLSHFNVASA